MERCEKCGNNLNCQRSSRNGIARQEGGEQSKKRKIPLRDGMKMAGERTFKRSGQAGSKGRAPLFLVSKQNLNASSWRI
jgi:hypothetical protein